MCFSLQLPGQLHGGRQRRSDARLSSQRPEDHCTPKEVLCTHTGHLQAGEETPFGLDAPHGGGGGACWSHHRSGAHRSSVLGVHDVSVCVQTGFVFVCVFAQLRAVFKLSFPLPLCAAFGISKLHLPTAPPPLNEGESLVSRILQLGPPGTKFLG